MRRATGVRGVRDGVRDAFREREGQSSVISPDSSEIEILTGALSLVFASTVHEGFFAKSPGYGVSY